MVPHPVRGAVVVLVSTFANASREPPITNAEGPCWGNGYTREVCCGVGAPGRGTCFDVAFTEEFCCGEEVPPDGFEAAPRDVKCLCGSSSVSLVASVKSALHSREVCVADAGLQLRRSPRMPTPSAAQSAALCRRFRRLRKPCHLAEIAGRIACAHWHALAGNMFHAARDAQTAATIARLLSHRSRPHCLTGLRALVADDFPFSSAEASMNAQAMGALAEDGSADEPVQSPGIRPSEGWRRRPKPLLGFRSCLDDIALRYKADTSMRLWQKQWGCSGGDMGEDRNFYSAVYHRLFGITEAHSPSGAPARRHLPTRVLEVGVCDGSGVAVWSDYFDHPESRVVALDLSMMLFSSNRPYLVKRGFNQSRVAAIVEANASGLGGQAVVTTGWGTDAQRTYRCSGLDAMDDLGPFDFIRDDASHRATDMVATFQALFPDVLRPGGVYSIEDMWSYPFKKNTATTLDDSGEYAYFFRLARDSLNYGWRFDGVVYNAHLANSWLQSPEATALEAWVDSVQFFPGQVIITKRRR